MILDSDVCVSLNSGSDELVAINELVDIVENVAGDKLKWKYNLSALQGVKGRNSDNAYILQRLSWSPSIKIEDGMEKTYRWIYDQVARTDLPRWLEPITNLEQ